MVSVFVGYPEAHSVMVPFGTHSENWHIMPPRERLSPADYRQSTVSSWYVKRSHRLVMGVDGRFWSARQTYICMKKGGA